MAADRYEEVERELARVVDRLAGMPLTKVERAMPDVQVAADALLVHLRTVDPDVPVDAALPSLGPTGQSAMIAVLGDDWLRAARTTGDADPAPVLAILVGLRHALP